MKLDFWQKWQKVHITCNNAYKLSYHSKSSKHHISHQTLLLQYVLENNNLQQKHKKQYSQAAWSMIMHNTLYPPTAETLKCKISTTEDKTPLVLVKAWSRNAKDSTMASASSKSSFANLPVAEAKISNNSYTDSKYYSTNKWCSIEVTPTTITYNNRADITVLVSEFLYREQYVIWAWFKTCDCGTTSVHWI